MDKRILKITDRIFANLKSPPTIEDLSEEFNVSASRLRQLFRKETEMPFGEYVRLQRLERARELLETTHLRVKEIGAAVGFGDQSFFNRAFKERFGLTPGEYHDKHCVTFKSPGSSSDEKQ